VPDWGERAPTPHGAGARRPALAMHVNVGANTVWRSGAIGDVVGERAPLRDRPVVPVL
jgi:hypothetical protein